MSKDTLTFYGGMNTIGGVHIVFESGKKALVFDLGLAPRGLFNEQVKGHPEEGILSYLLTRTAPPVTELYDPSYLKSLKPDDLLRVWNKTELPNYEQVEVFISHIHQDHMALLPYLDKSASVYMNRDAASIYKAVVASGEYGGTKAEIKPLADLEEVNVGDFRFQIIEVDHDTSGASGFILRSEEHTIAFTGDWRRHGRHSGRMDRFIELCRKAEVDILITEGTRIRQETIFNKPVDRKELDVANTYSRVMAEAKGLVYVNILARNIERVADIITATKQAGRKLVMDQSTATFWVTAIREGIEPLKAHPAVTDTDTILVLPNRINKPVVEEIDLPYEQIEFSDIVKNKSHYSIYLIYQQLHWMAELEACGETGLQSHYVHADGNPLHQSDETLLRWLSMFNVSYEYCATGGHAAPDEISELTEAIRPKIVIPLHSMHPSLLDSRNVRTFLPTYGQRIEIEHLLGYTHQKK
ncbi:mRNA degradation ribonuclease J1/J2 [Paenibacillus castaneae]|uniref:MBL fold metallo-hydrolase n=1 Tax=Paenibacillus castaneae TaxID=474957 RepID=UPI00141B6010|nr:MBL fold metallo-hydrolase [Paenibacillus castaneae]NIK80307.1 mRNA degradation ribonuclease J1/J2 [Paenibacillus castaneae]